MVCFHISPLFCWNQNFTLGGTSSDPSPMFLLSDCPDPVTPWPWPRMTGPGADPWPTEERALRELPWGVWIVTGKISSISLQWQILEMQWAEAGSAQCLDLQIKGTDLRVYPEGEVEICKLKGKTWGHRNSWFQLPWCQPFSSCDHTNSPEFSSLSKVVLS